MRKKYKNIQVFSRNIADSFSRLWMSPTWMASRQESVTSSRPEPTHLFAMEPKLHIEAVESESKTSHNKVFADIGQGGEPWHQRQVNKIVRMKD